MTGCPERQLGRLTDGEFDVVVCPRHGWQYPVPRHLVPPHLADDFLEWARGQHKPAGVHREMVFPPAQWRMMAGQFLAMFGNRPECRGCGEEGWG